MNHELPFDKYKPYLVDYLRMNGIDANIGKNCTCPWHNDSTASFSVFIGKDGFPAFNCFAGCGGGDIYNAVEKITGETDSKKQFEEIERIFGNGTSSPLPVIQKKVFTEEDKKDFIPDSDALGKFTDWLKAFPHSSDYILGYFAKRAAVSSKGKIQQYPHEILRKLLPYFLWYPGKKEAIDTFGIPTLLKAGLPYSKKDGKVVDYNSMTQFPPEGEEGKIYVALNTDTCYFWNGSSYEKYKEEPRKLSWWSEGVVTPTNIGYKLFFYCYDKEKQKEVSKKYNPRSIPLLFADELKDYAGKTIVILEGEMDAIVCRASGIENVFATGGLNGLSKPKIKKYIIPANIAEIILFADKDSGEGEHPFRGQKKFGIMPLEENDGIRETLPEQLLAEGYKGKIRVTVLPDDCPFKDPDEAILNGRLDLVKAAIANARDYVAPEKPSSKKKGEAARKNAATRLTEDLLAQILAHKKLQLANMNETDADIFVRALRNALPSLTDTAKTLLVEWGAAEETLEKPGTMPPDQMLKVMRTYRAPKALIEKVCSALNFEPPAKKNAASVFKIDFAQIKKLQAWKEYLYSGQSQYAASVCCHIFAGQLVYDNGKNQFFRYNAPVWNDEPNVDKLVTDTLTTIIDHFYPKETESTRIALERYRKEAADKTFQRKVTDSIKKDTEHEIWKRTIEFDNPNITSETLTLMDGVLDFSGKEPVFRDAKPSEYRKQKMPFMRSQIENAAEPKNYLEFIKGNFTDPATQEMFERFLSLIPARTAQYKIAAFLNGGPNTGKSTTMRLIKSIYTYWQEYPVGEPESLVKSIPSDIVLKERNQTKSDDGRSPTLASIVNAGGAFCDETDNMQKIDAKLFKRFTGGSTISFRDNYESMKEHSITAQLILGTNELPDIITPGDSKLDEAILSRIMVVPFLVKHERVVSGDITEAIRPEYPAIIMRYARIYCQVRHELKGNIPQSDLALEWKSKYIERNKNDIQRFVEERLEQEAGAATSWQSLYSAFCDFAEYRLDEFGIPTEKNSLTQRKFTAKMKSYFDISGANADSIYIGGKSARGLKNYRLKTQSDGQLDFGSPATTNDISEPPEDDPFADATPVNPPPPEDNGNDGEQYDIF